MQLAGSCSISGAVPYGLRCVDNAMSLPERLRATESDSICVNINLDSINPVLVIDSSSNTQKGQIH